MPNMDGPLKVGKYRDAGALYNVGTVVLEQRVPLAQNSTAAVSGTLQIPENSRIVDIFLDNLTVWDSATSATGTVGTAAAGTQYAGALNAKTAGRQTPAYSSAQLTAMASPATTAVVFTITPVGATTAGLSHGVIRYIMN